MSVDQQLESAISVSIDTLEKFSVPLYLDIENKPVPFGTGFFVRKDDEYFLVSAAHVLEKSLSHGLYYYSTPSIKRYLSGRLVLSKVKDNRANDRIDIGVVKMTGEMLPPYPEVQKFAMDYSYLAPSYLPRSRKHYSFIGFPATKSKVSNISRSVEVQAYAYRSDSVPDDKYSFYGLVPDTHVVLPLDLKRVNESEGTIINFPKPQGMSGSPVVVLYELEDGGSRVFPVVAVAIEYKQKSKAVIATDVKYVIAAIDNAT